MSATNFDFTPERPHHERDEPPQKSFFFQGKRLGRVLALYANRYLRKRGVPALVTQLDVLAAIELYAGTGRGIKELAAPLGLEPSTLSRSISRLSGRGLVLKMGLAGDRRRRIPLLTEAGRALLASGIYAVVGVIQGRLARRFFDHEPNLRAKFEVLVAAVRGQMSVELYTPETEYQHYLWCGVPEPIAREWATAGFRSRWFT